MWEFRGSGTALIGLVGLAAVGVAAASAPPAGAAVLAGPAYTFVEEHGDGSPYTWSPCVASIPVVLHKKFPSGEVRRFAGAVKAIAAASGLPLRLSATRTPEKPSMEQTPDGQITVGMVPNTYDALGIGGPVWDSDGYYTAGAILMTRAVLRQPNWLRRSAYMHELGHTVGLGHSKRPGDLMTDGYIRARSLSPSDRAGLKRVGQRGTCD